MQERFAEIAEKAYRRRAAAKQRASADLTDEGDMEGAGALDTEHNLFIEAASLVRKSMNQTLVELSGLGVEDLEEGEVLSLLFPDKQKKAKKAAGEALEVKERPLDFTPREEKFMQTTLAISPDRKSFQNPTFQDVVRATYSDEYDKAELDDKRRKQIEDESYRVRAEVIRKLQVAMGGQISYGARFGGILEWMQDQPEYNGKNVQEIALVIRRLTPYESLANTSATEDEATAGGVVGKPYVPFVSPARNVTEVFRSYDSSNYIRPVFNTNVPVPDSGKQPVDTSVHGRRDRKPGGAGSEQQSSEARRAREKSARAVYKVEFPDGKAIETSGETSAKYLEAISQTSKDNRIKYSEWKKKVHGNKNVKDITMRAGISTIKSFLKDHGWNLEFYRTAGELRKDRKIEQEYYVEKIDGEGEPVAKAVSSKKPAGASKPEEIVHRPKTQARRIDFSDNEQKEGSIRDLSEGEVRILDVVFEVDEDGTDFSRWSCGKITEKVYAGKLQGLDEKERKRRTNSLSGAVLQSYRNAADKIDAIKGDLSDLPPRMRAFVDLVRGQDVYANLSFADLAQIARRQIPFEEVLAKAQAAKARLAEQNTVAELSLSELQIVYPLFEINSSGTDYKYRFTTEMIDLIGSEQLSGIKDSQERRSRISSMAKTARRNIQNAIDRFIKMEGIPESDLPEDMKKFMEWLRSKPEFAKLSMDELAMIAERKMPFSEVLRRMESNDSSGKPIEHVSKEGRTGNIGVDKVGSVTPNGAKEGETEKNGSVVFTETELYSLANILLTQNTGLGREDTEVLQKIEESHRAEHKYAVKSRGDMDALLRKVAQFDKSPKEFLDANGDNKDAVGLLLVVQGLGEEKLRKLGLLQKK